MQISTHFSLSELTFSQTADRLGLDNTPTDAIVDNLVSLAHGLEMVRALVGVPLYISSGYRSPQVNRAVGGQLNSQHCTGQAADISAPAYGDASSLLKVILANKLPFDQAILEYYRPATLSEPSRGWCHISFVRGTPRQQALVIDVLGTRGYETA
jgi:hypothetical protein